MSGFKTLELTVSVDRSWKGDLMVFWAVAAAAAFNLVCSGTHTKQTPESKTTTPFSDLYRIDLDEGLWCTEDCKVPQKLAEVNATTIHFIKSESIEPQYKFSMSMRVSRETGKFDGYVSSVTLYSRTVLNLETWEGQCEKAAFTGFPAVPTKF